MRLKTRVHEWLADHVSWIQYPNVTMLPERRPFRLRDLSGKQRAWFYTGCAWLLVFLLAIYGNWMG